MAPVAGARNVGVLHDLPQIASRGSDGERADEGGAVLGRECEGISLRKQRGIEEGWWRMEVWSPLTTGNKTETSASAQLANLFVCEREIRKNSEIIQFPPPPTFVSRS